jgi:hypothetical protein
VNLKCNLKKVTISENFKKCSLKADKCFEILTKRKEKEKGKTNTRII